MSFVNKAVNVIKKFLIKNFVIAKARVQSELNANVFLSSGIINKMEPDVIVILRWCEKPYHLFDLIIKMLSCGCQRNFDNIF